MNKSTLLVVSITALLINTLSSAELEVSFDDTPSAGQPWDMVVRQPTDRHAGRTVRELVDFNHVMMIGHNPLIKPKEDYVSEVRNIIKTATIASCPSGKVDFADPFHMCGLWRGDAMVGYVYVIGNQRVLTIFESRRPVNLLLSAGAQVP